MGSNKSQNFLTQHIEKIVLGLFAVVSLFLLYMGFQLPDYTEKQKPQQLEELAVNVKRSIDDDHWEAIADERVVETEFEERVTKAQQPIATDPYATTSGWEWKSKKAGARREDPALVPPGKPHMVGVLGAVAVQHSTERSYPLQDLAEAEPIEASAKPDRQRRQRPRRGASAAASPYGESSYGSGASPYGSGASPYGSGASPYGTGEAAGAAPGYGAAGAEGPGATPKTLQRKLAKKQNEGFDVSALTPASAINRVTPETAHFIAGTALVPHRQLLEAYRVAFENAQGANPRRDTPTYWEFEVERADVTDKPVDQLTDADWKKVITFAEFRKRYERWAGTAADVTPRQYADEALTWPLPPLMLHDNVRFAVHPDLPLTRGPRAGQAAGYASAAQPAGTRPGATRPKPGEEPGEAAEEEEGAAEGEGAAEAPTAQAPAAQVPGRASFGGPPTLGGGGYGAGGASPYGGGGASPYGGGESPYGGGGASPYGGGGASPYGGGGASPYGGGGASPYGGMGMGMGMGGGRQPEHKMVRFYDFADARNPDAPKPGRKYVYRVHFAVEDPNFPALPQLQPPMRYLSPEVYARVSQKEQKAGDDPTKRDPRLWSDWSVPSDPVSLPSLTRVLVGPVDPADTAVARRGGQQGAQTVEYQRNPAQAEVVALRWDTKLATDLIMQLETRPGSVLARNTEAHAIDPIDLSIRKTEEQYIDASGVVLDAFGGGELELADDEEITAPGFMLMFDAEGNLKVLDEIANMKDYRLYSFAEEREAAEAAAEAKTSAGSGAGGYPGGEASGGPGGAYGAPGGGGYGGPGGGAGYGAPGGGGYGGPGGGAPAGGRGGRTRGGR